MAFCDYTFYTTKYLGNVIAETDFPRMAMRASEKLNAITYGRIHVYGEKLKFVEGVIDTVFDDDMEERIRKCTCAIAEKLYDVEIAEKTIRLSGVGVKSVNSGGESISFSDINTFATTQDLNNVIYDVAKDYLWNTGLLYAGY